MTRRTAAGCLAVALLVTGPGVPRTAAQESGATLSWDDLAPIPDEVGLAAPFTGIDDDVLVVAGGANFPDGAPWDGFAKKWHDRIFFLTAPSASWQVANSRLPRPLAYGVAFSTPQGIVCAGGSDAERCHDEVFLMRYTAGDVEILDGLPPDRQSSVVASELPALPRPLAFSGGARIGDSLYIAGGQSSMEAGAPSAGVLLRLDLSAQGEANTLRWESLPWPEEAPPRILPVVVAQRDGRETCLYLFSGRSVQPDGEVVLLRDAWRFSPGDHHRGDPPWKQLTDVPSVVMAGSGFAAGSEHIYLLGGDDGRHWGEDLRDAHPGFPRDLSWIYHTLTDRWTAGAPMPLNLVTTSAVRWYDAIVVPGGEVRPAVRSPRVLRATPQGREAVFATLDYIVLALYLAMLVAMGVYFSRREKGTDDFFLAGRRVPWWAAGLSIFGTQLSAITFMAIPAQVYRTDWIYFIGQLMILAAAPIVVSVFLPFYRRLGVTTAYEYLELRFDLTARWLGSGAFLLLQLGRMGVVLYLPALALSTVTGISIYVSISVMGVLAIAYTVLGGIEAVIWTDVLQVVVLIGGAIVSLSLILGDLPDGFTGALSAAQAEGKLSFFDLSWDLASATIAVVFIGKFLEQFVPYTADQTVVQRYLTTRDEKQAARSIWTNGWLAIPASVLFFALGTALWAYYRSHPESLDPFSSSDDILPWFIATRLPVGLSGLVIAGLFAASMSSLDSSLNSCATAITTDFYRRLKPTSSDRQRLRLARWLTVLLGVVGTACAIYMAWAGSKSIWDSYLKIIGLFGGGLAGLFALGIFSRRANRAGATVGFLASAVVLFLTRQSTSLHFFLYAGIGMLSCVAIGWLVSVVTPPPRADVRQLTLQALRASRRDPAGGPEA